MTRERVEHNGSDHQGRGSNGTGSIWRRRKRIPDMPAEEQAPSLSDELRTICAERGKRLSGRVLEQSKRVMAGIEIRRAFIDEKHRTENDKYERMIE